MSSSSSTTTTNSETAVVVVDGGNGNDNEEQEQDGVGEGEEAEETTDRDQEVRTQAQPPKQTDMSDTEFLKQAYGDQLVLAEDGTDALLMNGMRVEKKRNRDLSEEALDDCHERMHEYLLSAAKRIVRKERQLDAVRKLVAADPEDQLADTDTSSVSQLYCVDDSENATGVLSAAAAAAASSSTSSSNAMVVSDTGGNGSAIGSTTTTTTTFAGGDAAGDTSERPRYATPGRKLYRIGSAHTHALLGKVRLVCASWSDNVKLDSTNRRVGRDKQHSGFPHVVRLGKSGNVELYVEHARTFDLCAEIRYICGGVFPDTHELLDRANQMEIPTTSDSSDLRFELYLIYSSGDGRHGDDEKPFASDDERSHFRPGACIAKDDTGNTCTNLFANFNPSHPREVFYGTCKNGKIVFRNISFRKDALSSNVTTNNGSFRFVIRATHPSLKDLVNYNALSPEFFVGARVRATAPARTKGGGDDGVRDGSSADDA